MQFGGRFAMRDGAAPQKARDRHVAVGHVQCWLPAGALAGIAPVIPWLAIGA
jgi:hypothetical protein